MPIFPNLGKFKTSNELLSKTCKDDDYEEQLKVLINNYTVGTVLKLTMLTLIWKKFWWMIIWDDWKQNKYLNITKAKHTLRLFNSASTICPWVYAADVLNN